MRGGCGAQEERIRDYWIDRLSRGGITSVGRLGLSPDFNRAMYATLAGNVQRAVERHGLLPVDRALDVGTGLGFWVEYWHAAGVPQVDACDFVPAAVEALAPRGNDDYFVADLAQPAALPRQYPLISCMFVLLHMMDSRSFDSALANLAGAVEPGGHLLLGEPALTLEGNRRYSTDGVSVVRTVPDYAARLRPLGLELVAVEPATPMSGAPLEASNPALMSVLRFWWLGVRTLDRIPPARPGLARAIKAADALARRAHLSPSSKLIVFRRASATPHGC